MKNFFIIEAKTIYCIGALLKLRNDKDYINKEV